MTFANPLALLLWPVLVALTVWWAWHVHAKRVVVAMRVGIVTLLVLALANPGGQSVANTERLVVLVDQSKSMSAVDDLEALSAPGVMVIPFGGDETNIEAALKRAKQLVTRGRVLLISDGAQTEGDALRGLEEWNVPVDVLWTETITKSDAALQGVTLPGAVWAGEEVPVSVAVYATSALTATVRVIQDEQLIAEQVIALPAGALSFDFSVPANAEGVSVVRAEVKAEGDNNAVNDVASAIMVVRPTPNVLIVSDRAGASTKMLGMLTNAGVAAQTLGTKQLPVNLNELLKFQVLMLMDVSAGDLNLEQWAAVRAFTQSYGRGLVVTGGRASFTLGAYETTPLAEMLPVTLEPPRREERPPVALVLVIDNSGSMGPGQDFGPPKIDLAKEAAMRAVEILQANDRVGVIGFSDNFRWFVHLETLGQGLTRRDVLDRINTMTARGGTNMLSPLQAGLNELAALDAERKHLILLSDGETYRGNASDFETLVKSAAEADVTVSTIAMNTSDAAWQELMANIAAWGKGRYHFAREAADIPNLLLSESQAVNSDPIQRGRTQFQVAPHPLVRGFTADDIPAVTGYVALTPRPEAEVALASGSFGDPMLSAWQFGLGRVVAWTSDVGGEWSDSWNTWPDAPHFWSQVVRYALPDPKQGALFAIGTVRTGQVTLQAFARDDVGQSINLAEGQLLFRQPTGVIARVAMPQTAPGEYAVTFDAPEVGAYRALVILEKDGQRWETPIGFVVPYPAEFNPRFAPNEELLKQIAGRTGGKVISNLAEVTLPRAVNIGVAGYAPYFIFAALALWVAEIALRRRIMPWKIQ